MPLTVKIRTGVQERVNLAHRLLPELRDWGAALVTVGLGAQRVWGPREHLADLPNGLSSCFSLLLSGSPSVSVSICLFVSLSLSLSLSLLIFLGLSLSV